MKHVLYLILFNLYISCWVITAQVKFELATKSSVTSIYVDKQSDELIKWAVNDFVKDLEEISGKTISVTYINKLNPNQQGIIIGNFNDRLIQNSSGNFKNKLDKQWEKFIIRKEKDRLFVTGSDIRGTVFAIFEIAKRIGISPWKWWADVQPVKQENIILELPAKGIEESPSVQFRGIFLNDEDWGLQPWAATTFEPETKDIGPKTYEKIFQLLLRLKANTLWPAMHHCTRAFFSINGNKEMAEKYHIFIGTSHAEPMLRNNVDEWDKEKYGDYNYFTNPEKVKAYWQERIDETKKGEYIITMGMRGIHDSGMEGNASQEEKIRLLETIINDQRQILSNSLNKSVREIPQMFIPYKEVLELYNNGLQLPGDITLIWTDDNYGYIRRLSNESEQQRKGGSGIYYHLSYWGRPHDYLWLSTTQPGLIWYEMSRAYQNGARKIWIANAGDIKPAEYNMEFFLDLAWNVKSINENSIKKHLEDWCTREFGRTNASEIADILEEYYRLAFLRKPEFMGWSQTEPNTSVQPGEFTQLNNNELQRRIDAYTELYNKTENIKTSVPPERLDAYFQLVEYPVKGAALMNFKFLYAQKCLFTSDINKKTALAKKVQQAYDEITSLTYKYNNEISNGKWKQMMSMNPRDLAVFSLPGFHLQDSLPAPDTSTINETIKPMSICVNNYTVAKGVKTYEWKTIQGLGYSNASLTLSPFSNYLFPEEKPYVEYEFQINKTGKYEVEIRSLPTHSNNFDFKIGVSVNDEPVKEYEINTKGRSESWKKNVLRNAVIISHPVTFNKTGKQTLRVYLNHTGIVLDQIAINPEKYGAYYEITR